MPRKLAGSCPGTWDGSRAPNAGGAPGPDGWLGADWSGPLYFMLSAMPAPLSGYAYVWAAGPGAGLSPAPGASGRSGCGREEELHARAGAVDERAVAADHRPEGDQVGVELVVVGPLEPDRAHQADEVLGEVPE